MFFPLLNTLGSTSIVHHNRLHTMTITVIWMMLLSLLVSYI